MQSMLLDVIESKRKGEHKYDFVDYNSNEMIELKNELKRFAEAFDNLSSELRKLYVRRRKIFY